MKKTISISIAQTLFYIEEDTYEKLDDYLNEIKKYFASYDDSFEIIQDIESRICEKFLEFSNKDSGGRIITAEDVDKLIETMGWPQEFGTFERAEKEEEKTHHTREPRQRSPRRLFRDKHNAVIGGVASGLAIYLGTNVTLVRIIFIVLAIFGNGIGLLIYIILWFVLPVAETATEILEMQGGPVNLHNVKKIIEEKINEVGGKEKIKSNVKNFFEEVRNLSVMILKKIGLFISRVAGFLLKVVSVAGITTMAVFLFATMLPTNYQNVESIFTQFHPLPYFYTLALLVFLAVTIPFVFLNNIANVFLGKHIFKKPRYAIVTFSIWVASLALGTILFLQVANQYILKANSIIQENQTVVTPAVTDFSKLTVQNGINVVITQGTTTSVEIHGSKTSVEQIALVQSGDTLNIDRKFDWNFCLFCNTEKTQVFITVRNLSDISLENGARVEATLNIDTLKVDLKNGSELKLNGSANTLNAQLENASDLNAADFPTLNVAIDLSNASHANINAGLELTGRISNSSTINQYGTASTERIEKNNGSRIKMKEIEE